MQVHALQNTDAARAGYVLYRALVYTCVLVWRPPPHGWHTVLTIIHKLCTVGQQGHALRACMGTNHSITTSSISDILKSYHIIVFMCLPSKINASSASTTIIFCVQYWQMASSAMADKYYKTLPRHVCDIARVRKQVVEPGKRPRGSPLPTTCTFAAAAASGSRRQSGDVLWDSPKP